MIIKSEKLTCINPDGKHQIYYHQIGNLSSKKSLICVHGLTRNSRDFDHLANVLKQDYRVICPDVVGRGESDWLSNPSYYGLPLYVSDLLTLIQHLNLTEVDWLGTSMGGLIGMLIASQPNSPIKRLILNDVGAYIPAEVLERIAKYLTQDPPEFDNFNQVKDYVKKIYATFGELTDSQWEHLAKYSVKLTEKGNYKLNYDPCISANLKLDNNLQRKPIDLWETWSAIKCPVLLLHGEESDLLLPETIEKMQLIKPDLKVIHFSNCGHAPALMSLTQIEVIQKWLLM